MRNLQSKFHIEKEYNVMFGSGYFKRIVPLNLVSL
jgi:hypothetical protein